MNKGSDFPDRLSYLPVRPFIALTLFALLSLAWNGPVFSGEIHNAAKNGDLGKIKALMRGNPDLVFSKDDGGDTPLHYAAANGRRAVAEFLVTNKADVNAKGRNGSTPLHYAAFGGNGDVTELLLAHGADVNAKDNKGNTPMSIATLWGNRDVVELLNQYDRKGSVTTGSQTHTVTDQTAPATMTTAPVLTKPTTKTTDATVTPTRVAPIIEKSLTDNDGQVSRELVEVADGLNSLIKGLQFSIDYSCPDNLSCSADSKELSQVFYDTKAGMFRIWLRGTYSDSNQSFLVKDLFALDVEQEIGRQLLVTKNSDGTETDTPIEHPKGRWVTLTFRTVDDQPKIRVQFWIRKGLGRNVVEKKYDGQTKACVLRLGFLSNSETEQVKQLSSKLNGILKGLRSQAH